MRDKRERQKDWLLKDQGMVRTSPSGTIEFWLPTKTARSFTFFSHEPVAKKLQE
jgi:hypothetical protein